MDGHPGMFLLFFWLPFLFSIFQPAQALATSVVIDREYAWQVPESWSLADAATVPVVYTTAYYALVCRGRIKKGESILIHGGSGGVGQAAIAIALSMGCEVFTTVGSNEKREFLKAKFPALKDHNFANSRSTDFELHIRHVTRGKGVNLVLNSLAQEMLQASVRCLAQHGRFLEIGKVDLSQNNALGMAVFLKNVSFHGILLDAIMDQGIGNKEDWKEVAALLEEGIRTGVVQPLAYSAFPPDKAEEAFRFMSAGKHIGKVLMEIRHEEAQKVVVPKPITVKAICRTQCHPQHVYLITGGLGGFGLELAQWLINRFVEIESLQNVSHCLFSGAPASSCSRPVRASAPATRHAACTSGAAWASPSSSPRRTSPG